MPPPEDPEHSNESVSLALPHLNDAGKLCSAGMGEDPESSEHYSYRVAGSSMGRRRKKKGMALSSGEFKLGRRVRSEAAGE